MKERLAQFLAAENISRNDFATKIGVQRSNITHILDGRNKPSFDFIEKMLTNYPQINADWLILGLGDMYKRPVMGSLFPAAPQTAADPDVSKEVQATAAPAQAPANERKAPPEDPRAEAIATAAAASTLGKKVERIIILYSDKSFETYHAQ